MQSRYAKSPLLLVVNNWTGFSEQHLETGWAMQGAAPGKTLLLCEVVCGLWFEASCEDATAAVRFGVVQFAQHPPSASHSLQLLLSDSLHDSAALWAAEASWGHAATASNSYAAEMVRLCGADMPITVAAGSRRLARLL